MPVGPTKRIGISYVRQVFKKNLWQQDWFVWMISSLALNWKIIHDLGFITFVNSYLCGGWYLLGFVHGLHPSDPAAIVLLVVDPIKDDGPLGEYLALG